MSSEPSDYCRDIEAYLCRKNDGHLIRIVGPAFELVSGWAADGVPLKVAFRGIDRYFERYYRKGPRRRPVRVDFCDADVREVFDEWRRAVGVTSDRAAFAAAGTEEDQQPGRTAPGASRRVSSLPAHLERALERLTGARVSGRLGASADALIDRVSQELDAARASSRGVRGAARQTLIARLKALDSEMLRVARDTLDEGQQRLLQQESEAALAPFRDTMPNEMYQRACEAALDQLVRERFSLPTLIVEA